MKGSVTRIAAAAASDVGQVREGNEDSFFSGHSVFAVADGMGGHQAGEVASALALEPVRDLDVQEFSDDKAAADALVEAIEAANRNVVERSLSDENLRGMGTTLTAVMIHGDRLLAAHVGDSRAYLLRPDESISQLTTDHTLVERLVREGRLSRDEAAAHPQRNVITRAIGNEPDVIVDSLPPLQLQSGDRVLLCSDGLTGPLEDDDIQALIDVAGGGQDAVDALIAAANEAGGPDNITVVLIEIEGDQTSVASAGLDSGDDAQTADAAGAPVSDGPPEQDESPVSDRPREVRQIRTGSTHQPDNWASTMGRLGARQGTEPAAPDKSGTGRRVLAGLLGAVLLLGLLAGGGYFLLSRAYFVGDHEGSVAVYRGLNERVAGVPLYWVIEDEISDVAVNDLPGFRRQDVTEGLSAGTLREARQVVTGLRRQVEEEGAGATPAADPTPTAGPGT